MRNSLCHLLLISLLFVSIEGAADMGDNKLAHTDHASVHADQQAPADTTPDVDADHCEHCCHGHTVSITSAPNSNVTSSLASAIRPGRSSSFRNIGRAPPTPPPIA